MEYRQLYERYYTMVYRLSLLLLKNTQDAEDAAQSIFLKIMEKQPSFADEDHTRAWLLTVTRNHCRDIQRSFWHKHRTDMEHIPEPTVEPFDRQESLLFEIFQSLPKKQREAVYLYYFEDYSIKEIAHILDRKESTVQSQLFAARKRMKKQFLTTKAATLILCLAAALGLSGVAADAASGGRVSASIKQFLSTREEQLADETISLPIEVYASNLAGINDSYVILANERGLLIYDRSAAEIAAALDLQEIECNYLNANSIATRIFLSGDKLYLFNENINQKLRKNESAPLPKFVYIYDLSVLDKQNSNAELTFDESEALTRSTDNAEIQKIYELWTAYAKDHIKDTFDQFYGADFLSAQSERYDGITFSENSLIWTDVSGKNLISCLVVDKDSNYELYTKQPDGSLTCEPLNLVKASDEEQNTQAKDETNSDSAAVDDKNVLPKFVYSGDDEILAVICAYMCTLEEDSPYADDPHIVYIPEPIIYDTITEGEDLMVFCNLYSHTYYRNGNTLTSDSGGEAPARLRLHPDADAALGYEIVEDLRTGDGSYYVKGIKEFCADYPGMAEKYFQDSTYWQYIRTESLKEYTRALIRTELITMYVRDNDLDIKYYKDYGWDPVLIESDS